MGALDIANGRQRIRYVGVENSTRKYATRTPPICAIICFACARVPHKWLEYRGLGHAHIFGSLVVFSPSGAAIPIPAASPFHSGPSAAAVVVQSEASKA